MVEWDIDISLRLGEDEIGTPQPALRKRRDWMVDGHIQMTAMLTKSWRLWHLAGNRVVWMAAVWPTFGFARSSAVSLSSMSSPANSNEKAAAMSAPVPF